VPSPLCQGSGIESLAAQAERRNDAGSEALMDIGVVPSVPDYLRALYAHRDFVIEAPMGQLRAQTQGTAVGAGWHLLNPLLTAALYYVVFGIIFGGRGEIEDYPLFLVVGIFTFVFTSRCVQLGGRSLLSNMGLVTQIAFPRIALPLSATIAETVAHSIALLGLLLVVPSLGVTPNLGWLFVVPIVLMQSLFNLGLASFAARLVFQFRDVQNLLPHLLRFWMYASGLFFTVEFVVDAFGSNAILLGLFYANPGYIFMSLMRGAILDSYSVAQWMWLAAAGWCVSALAGSFFFFRQLEVEYGRG
jgi:teichoic acid transport system permease protein